MNTRVLEGFLDLKGLPHAAFSDPLLFQRERRDIFRNHWISIGLASQVPAKGDICPVEIAGEPLLITRDGNDRIHVFYNVCRHRGLRLVESACSRANQLITCPYHTWTYGVDGALRTAPWWDRTEGSGPDAATRDQLGLRPVRFAVWFDTIFVNLSGKAAPFQEFIGTLQSRWTSIDTALLRLVHLKTDYNPKANWKLICENFLDGYHVPWLHSQVGSPEAGIDFQTLRISDDIFGAWVPRGESERPRTGTPLPTFPGIDETLRGSHHFLYLFPNTMIALGSEWMMVLSLDPEAADASREIMALYLVGDEATGGELAAQRREFIDQMVLINDQDMELVPRLHASRISSAADACTFAPFWDELAFLLHGRLARATDYTRPAHE